MNGRMSPGTPGVSTDGEGLDDRPEAPADQTAGSTSTNRAVPPDLYALPALLTVAETAEVLRVGRGWVYQHAAELGAVKLGLGQTAPLRIPREGIRRIAGMSDTRRGTRSVPAAKARGGGTWNGELRARPRL